MSPQALIFKNLNVLALNGRKIFETWYRTRWLLESGVVDVRPLITKELPLEEYERRSHLLAAGEACKIVALPGGRRARRAAEDAGARAVPRRGQVAAPIEPLDERSGCRARRAPRGRHLQAVQHASSIAPGAARPDRGRGEVLDPLLEQLPRARRHRPEVVEAGIEGLRRYGAGTASVRFICGTFEPHLELERELADLVGTEASLTYVSCWNANEAAASRR